MSTRMHARTHACTLVLPQYRKLLCHMSWKLMLQYEHT